MSATFFPILPASSITCPIRPMFEAKTATTVRPVALEKISLMYRKNLYYTEELGYYQTIKEDSLKSQKWLHKNLTENNIDLPYSSDENLYYDKEISFCNGKINDQYTYYNLKVKGIDFKSSYDFIAIYNKLFFSEKILPEEYENWKKSSGYIESEE